MYIGKIFKSLYVLSVVLAVSPNFGSEQQKQKSQSEGEGAKKMVFELTSTAFEDGEFIPAKYTADGENVSPPLTWSNPPEGVKSFALICDDPDAPGGTWVHWVIYNIAVDESSLPEAVPKSEALPSGALQGITDFGRIGYGGPAPPKGPAHRYFFRIYALDTKLDLAPGAAKQNLLDAMDGHILEQTQLMGKYRRS